MIFIKEAYEILSMNLEKGRILWVYLQSLVR